MANSVDSKPSPRKVSYSNCAQLVHDDQFQVMLLEPRPFRPFKTSEEYLYAMKEDLAEWLNTLYGLDINVDNFMKQLETGVLLCRHANHVLKRAREYEANGRNSLNIPIPNKDVVFRPNVNPGTFQARDNVSNFITWCRALNIHECLLFETDDLVMRKNEKSFILCLLEVARRGSKFGILAPTLVQFEEEIDRELAEEEEESNHNINEENVKKQIITNDLRSLHERVVELLSRCTCPTQYNLEYISDGKYRIGDTKVLIFVRILRSHVMVRVGGGWDTLEHYLDKHDPCRCRSGHRYSYSARLSMTPSKGTSNSPQMQVIYSRPNQPTTSASFPKRTQFNSRDVPQLLSSAPLNNPNNIFIATDVNKQNRQKLSPDKGMTRECGSAQSDSFSKNDQLVSSISPNKYNCSTNKSNTSLPKLLPKSFIDSSSSEYSENESKNLTNSAKNGSSLVNNRGKKCSPRKILKTNELIMNSDDKKSIRLNRRYSESDESSIASDEVIACTKSNSRNLARTTTKSPQQNRLNPQINRTNDSNHRLSKSRDSLINKSQSSDDVRLVQSNKLIRNSKTSHPISSSCLSSQRRSSADSSQLGCNGRMRYGSFPRSRSQSSHLRISESSPNKTNETQFSSSKPSMNSTDKTVKSVQDDSSAITPANSCRQVKTWTFKQRSRLPISNDLYKPRVSQSNSFNDFTDSQMNGQIRSNDDFSKSSEVDSSLENSNINSDKLLEKMRHLVNQYETIEKARHNSDDSDQSKDYNHSPSSKTVISTQNKPYLSKIPTLH